MKPYETLETCGPCLIFGTELQRLCHINLLGSPSQVMGEWSANIACHCSHLSTNYTLYMTKAKPPGKWKAGQQYSGSPAWRQWSNKSSHLPSQSQLEKVFSWYMGTKIHRDTNKTSIQYRHRFGWHCLVYVCKTMQYFKPYSWLCWYKSHLSRSVTVA